MSTETTVAKLPSCDIHQGAHDAAFDAVVVVQGRRTWANVCGDAFENLGGQLGTGRGQRLVLPDRYDELMTRRTLVFAAWMIEVEAAKERGLTSFDLWSPGIVLEPSGRLWLTGRDGDGFLLLELSIEPGSTEVVRRASPDHG